MRPWTFTKRENRIRKYLRSNAWRLTHLDRARSLRRAGYYRNRQVYIANTRRYEAEHPGYKTNRDRRAVERLSDSYIRQLIRKRIGKEAPITQEMMDATRRRVESIRSIKALRLITIANEIHR